MSQDAIDALVKPSERLELKAYRPTPDDVWTCGWGSTHGVISSTVWTLDQANDALVRDVADTETLGNLYFNDATQDQFDAICDCLFNVGPGQNGHKDGIVRLKNGRYSTLYTYWKNGFIAMAGKEILKWNRQGAIELPGLTKRRRADYVWFNGMHAEAAAIAKS